VPDLTQECVLKALTSLGFKQTDAEVYVSLTENGRQKAREIAETLKTQRRQVYRSLKTLQAKGIVKASTEHPTQFSAIPFEKILDTLIKANAEEAERLEQEKEKILTRWQTIIREDSAS
jgi:sugar-specific transcriptional regulator TrmB